MPRISTVLLTLGLVGVALLGTSAAATAKPQKQSLIAHHHITFTHGVASGDVTTRTAILWTRVDQETWLRAEVFDNPDLQGPPVFRRWVRAPEANDFTARVRAKRLKPDTTYYYRWRRGNDKSPVGTFTTAPRAWMSADSSFTYSGDSDGTKVEGVPFHGNFEVLDAIRAEGSDFFVYLGDTIYSDSSLAPEPATTLTEYRAKYKENREIEALPNLLKSTSTIVQWDDHEVMNDFSGQTVDPDRYANGREAFLEYMPMKRPSLQDAVCADNPLIRTFKRGSNVDLIVPDERSCRSASVEVECLDEAGNPDLAPTLPPMLRVLFGLPALPPPGCLEAVMDPSRTMLGPVQKQALKDRLLNSNARFKFVLSELAIQQFWALPYDRWEGYGAERAELLNFIRDNEIENVVFLTTDNHANIINEVAIDTFVDPEPIAEELITGPIATFTMEEEIINLLGPEYVPMFHAALSLAGVDCRAINTDSYGSVDVDADAETATITIKDENGATVSDDLDPTIDCTKTIGA